MNAYFASVEQQVTPSLRGKPVAVVPMLTDNTCCIAASYEAKAYGIKTGTRVGDAKKICPTLLNTVATLWGHVPTGKPIWVGVTLPPIIPIDQHIPSLFENPKQKKLSLVMDQINDKYGHNTAYFGDEPGAEETTPTRIAFTLIPDAGEF